MEKLTENLSQQKILVTGGAGFIGSHLCEALLKIGSSVTCLDNFSTGKRENIASFLPHANFRLIEGDIRNIETCKTACKNQDFVLHQAALGSVPRSIADPLTTNEVNISGFLNLISAAKDAQVKRMVYAASSSTYGDSENLPKVENHIGNPLSPYAVTKLVNELYAGVFKKVYDFDSIGLRYFNVFGERQDPDGAYAAVIPKFIKQFLIHQSPVINGNGEYSRDFTYVENVVQINLLALTTQQPQALNQIYNVAVGERTSLSELAETLQNLLSKFDPKIKNIPVKYGDYRVGDVPHSLASIQKAEKLLNYQPKFSLKTGLEKAVGWYWESLQ